MSVQFHRVKVAQVKRETPDAVSISFAIPPDLKDTFKYQSGQYLTFRLYIMGKEHRRAYSLSSSPLKDEYLTITSKRVAGGAVSNWLNENVKPGDELEVMPPLGRFIPTIDPRSQKNYIFFSGGSGITPVFSIMRTVLIAEPHCTCTLFYGNRNAESIIFHRELKELKEQYGERLQLIHTIDQYSDTWQGYSGMIDRTKATYFLNTYCKDTYAHAQYFICGPTAMMHEVEQALRDKLIPKENIHIERFTSDLEAVTEARKEQAEMAEELGFDASKGVKAKIILDGRETEIEIKEDQTVLEAAIDADLDPPFACQIAACATCRAKLREGKVSMDEREALTDSEIEEGYVLTCQSHPLTSYLVVDYDA